MVKKIIGKISSLQALATADLDSLVKFAERLMSEGKFSRASVVWRNTLSRFPERSPDGVYIRLARCYIELNRLDKAKDVLHRLELRNPPQKPMHLFDMILEIQAIEKDWPGIISTSTEIENYHDQDLVSGLIAHSKTFKSLAQRIEGIDSYNNEILDYKKTSHKNKKTVIYTAISNGYDSLKLPVSLNPNFDYVVFCDKPVPDTGVFKVRPLPYIDNDPTRSSRYVKTHPHTLLPEYETAIWVDASIMLLDDISSLLDEFNSSGKYFGAIHHPLRNNIYEEAEACIERSKDDAAVILNQMLRYKSENIIGDNLIESGFLMFKLDNPETGRLLDLWWREIDRHSRRDQLGLPYAIEILNVKWHRLMEKPTSVRNHPSFSLTPHSLNSTVNDTLNNLVSGGKSITPSIFNDEKKSVPVFKGSVDVVVCVHNAPDDIRLCLESVEAHKPKNKFRLIIVDDGSDIETKEYLELFASTRDWVKLMRKETASGYSKAANRGLKASTADIVFLLNSDTVVTSRWIDKMADTMFSGVNVGIVGPLSAAASHQSIPNHLSTKTQTAVNNLPVGYSIDDMNSFCQTTAASDIQPLVPLVHGFCQAINRRVIESVGYFDEKNFPRGYGEENDYCFRASDAGFSLAISSNTYIYHSKSKSYVGPERIKLMREGSKKLHLLHGERRIKRAIKTMQANPLLMKMRNEAQKLYDR